MFSGSPSVCVCVGVCNSSEHLSICHFVNNIFHELLQEIHQNYIFIACGNEDILIRF